MTPSCEALAKARIAEAFSAAPAYDAQARVQRAVAAQLADRIAALPLPAGARICEVGCGTGFLGAALGGRLADARWLATDLSPAMVEKARARLGHDERFDFAVADAEAPESLAPAGPFDLVCSSFAAQWFADLPAALARLSALLAPGGRMILTTLADGSLGEWRNAHADLGLTAGTPAYPSAEALAALRPGGLAGEVVLERHVETFARGRDFLEGLRAIGAGVAAAGHAPLGAGALRRVLRRFEAAGGRITYVVATCSFAPPDAPGLRPAVAPRQSASV